jgi:hypothetical protein
MIFVFNSTGSALALFVNRGGVVAPDRMTREDGYRPYAKAIRLEKLAREGVFGIGANIVELRYRDVKPPQPAYVQFAPEIPDGSIASDYVLFLFASGATLMRSSAEIVQQFSWEMPSQGRIPTS